ncbi:MAG TPA: type IIL restriction-modification enzyme MmeI, partial [Thermoanaerobaculia bacterium]
MTRRKHPSRRAAAIPRETRSGNPVPGNIFDIETGDFVAKWSASGAAERANKDAFLLDLCDLLGVPRPDPSTGDPERDRYTFERDVPGVHEGEKVTTRKMDLYKEGCFVLEAKQGSEEGSRDRHGAQGNAALG